MTNPSADDARPATAGRAPAPDPGQPGQAPQDPAETAAVQAEVAAAQAEAAAADAEAAAGQAEAEFAQAPVNAGANGDQPPLLRLVGVGKNFGPVRALTDINLDVPVGQVTALVGDNGAGKSTLIKTIAGIWTQDAGEILWEGKPVRLHSPKDATDLGIATVYQDLALADNLDIVQNMFLGREPVRHWVLNETTMEKRPSAPWPTCPWSRSARSGSRSGRCPAASARPSRWPGPCCARPSWSSWTSPRPPWASPRPGSCSSSSAG